MGMQEMFKKVIMSNRGILIVYAILFFGWILNLVRLVNSDFKEPYRNEVIRAVGVVIVPIGCVAGYITIDD